jgi:hypothetical protein
MTLTWFILLAYNKNHGSIRMTVNGYGSGSQPKGQQTASTLQKRTPALQQGR